MTGSYATYRLQFRNGMDFEKAADLVPYLARLGVSHLYASPLFEAAPGSTHGYDVTDYDKLDDSLGGLRGFKAMSARLKEHGLGLILDIVPNHMAASVHNVWWRDVLKHGRNSSFAGHFDIDWTQEKLLLPVLDRPYGDALDAGLFSIGYQHDGLTFEVSGHSFPLDPSTWPLVLDTAETGEPLDTPGRSDVFEAWSASPANTTRLRNRLSQVAADRIHVIHEAQPWRLTYWRAARDMLGYRRFFEVSDLVGIRVEDPRVFDDVHKRLFALVADGHVDGLRIDHIDGLVDPKGYLERLNAALPRPIPIWVEKILEQDERLRSNWPLAGTTGYEFLAMTAALLTNRAAEPKLDRGYSEFCSTVFDYAGMRTSTKREILARSLATELATLVRFAQRAFKGDIANRDWGADTLRRAISALLVAMPVYRTYFGTGEDSGPDRSLLAEIVEEALRDPEVDDPLSIVALAACLERPGNQNAEAFRNRFQQVSGALMAKAVEDTLFYRFNRLVSANEVGSDPGSIGTTPEKFHDFVDGRAARHPLSFNATATHDTKRGEDARMRIAAISEAPKEWIDATARFDRILSREKDIPDIDTNTRWMFYQALLGSWREDLSDQLSERFSNYLVKASRESKLITSWVAIDSEYEDALQQFVRSALSSSVFVEAFGTTALPFIEIGERKSLAQLALKLTLPGIPDIYQGSENPDLSLVDPDNRRPVDFAKLNERLRTIDDDRAETFADRKLSLLRFCLRIRRSHPYIFAGDYSPLIQSDSPHPALFAFTRKGRTGTLVVELDLSGRSGLPSKRIFRETAEISKERVVEVYPPPVANDNSEKQQERHAISIRIIVP